MTAERWRRIQDLFGRAQDLPPPDRPAFLRENAGDDPGLIQEVRSLLIEHEQMGSFLDTPLLPRETSALEHPVVITLSPADSRRVSRRPFFWFALGICILFSSIYLYAGWMIIRYGASARTLGYQISRPDDTIVSVDPHGPAAGKLRPGDRITAFNGDTRAGRIGVSLYIGNHSPGYGYRLTVYRPNAKAYLTVALLIGRTSRRLLPTLVDLAISLTFFVVAATLGLLAPQGALPRIGFVAALLAALRLAAIALNDYRGISTQEFESVVNRALWFGDPWHLAFAYDFFYLFVAASLKEQIWRYIRIALYSACCFYFVISASFLIVGFLDQHTAVSFAYAHSWIPRAYPKLMQGTGWQMFQLVAFGATCAVSVAGYLSTSNRDFRVRLRWILFGSVIGFSPLSAYYIATLLLQAIGLERVVSERLWSDLEDVCNSFVLALPVALAYALIKHKVMGIRVAVRRGVQYLLARRILQILWLIPVVCLLAPVLWNPNQTVAEVLSKAKEPGRLLLLAAVILAFSYRHKLWGWLDRRFLREPYDQELLQDILGQIRKMDSIWEMCTYMAGQLSEALHPASLQIACNISEQGQTIFVPSVPEGENSPFDRPWHIRVPIVTGQQRLVGHLLLGEKLSEEPFSVQDKKLLKALADQMAVFVENVWLRDKVDRASGGWRNDDPRSEGCVMDILKECPECGTCFESSRDQCSNDNYRLITPLPVGRVLHQRYRLERRIGAGGMGTVYEATDLTLKRTVAVKWLTTGMGGGGAQVSRFEREAQMLAQLKHENIVGLYDFARLGVGAYLVMERLYGRTWRACLQEERTLSVAIASIWFTQLMDALKAAHAIGIIHRDIKPENIFIVGSHSEKQCVKVLDFGLAKLKASMNLTETGVVIGSSRYMSPEQLAGREADERSDLFAIGVMVVETLLGCLPVRTVDYGQTLMDMLRTYSSHSELLWQVLSRFLSDDPERRFPTLAEAQPELIRALASISNEIIVARWQSVGGSCV